MLPAVRSCREATPPDGGDAADAQDETAQRSGQEPPIRCRACGHPLADQAQIMRPGEGGAGGVFVNPHGWVHEVLVLWGAPGAVPVGPASTAHSWFPGYAWTMGHCGGCGGHVGWAYDAVGEGRTPAHFWGLRVAAIVA